MSMNVSDQLVEMLKQAGVKRVYAITGDSLNPVNDAIRRDGTLEWIHVRHEESAAYAASMDAEINGIGCCMGSSGPGHVHLINGLYDANRSGNPVIAIASTCHTEKFGSDYFQETNPILLFNDCSKYNQIAASPKQFATMMPRAIQIAKEEKGVSVISLPGDVAEAPASDVPSSLKSYVTKSIFRPNDLEIKELAEIINNHKKIALYCGYGAKDAVKEVELLAEKLNATIAYSFRGKIFFDKPESQYTVGMNGLLGNPSGFKSLEKADVVLMLGTDFPYAEFMPKDNLIVQIDKRAEIIGRRAKVDYGYQGDIKDTLEVLLPFLNVKKDKDFLEKMHALYVEEEKKYEKPKDDAKENKLNPEDAAVLINKYASDDAIFTVDTGMTCVWAARLIKASKNRYLTGSFNHGSMANALPMAIGAAASDKNKQVIAMCGDGGLSMLLGDLATVMQYQYPIKIFVFNNRSLGMVKLEMEVSGYIDWQTNMINPPFDKIAELMNIKGIEVKNYQDLEPKIKEAMEHNGPVLVNIYTDSDTLAMPPKITFEQMRGFATTMVKKIGLGKFNEVENMVKAGIDTL